MSWHTFGENLFYSGFHDFITWYVFGCLVLGNLGEYGCNYKVCLFSSILFYNDAKFCLLVHLWLIIRNALNYRHCNQFWQYLILFEEKNNSFKLVRIEVKIHFGPFMTIYSFFCFFFFNCFWKSRIKNKT